MKTICWCLHKLASHPFGGTFYLSLLKHCSEYSPSPIPYWWNFTFNPHFKYKNKWLKRRKSLFVEICGNAFFKFEALLKKECSMSGGQRRIREHWNTIVYEGWSRISYGVLKSKGKSRLVHVMVGTNTAKQMLLCVFSLKSEWPRNIRVLPCLCALEQVT